MPQVAIGNNEVSKTTLGNNDTQAWFSSEHYYQLFSNHMETSRMGERYQLPVADPSTEGPNQSVVLVIQGPTNPTDLVAAAGANADYQASACPPDEVDFDSMLGKRPFFFTHVKIKSKTKLRDLLSPQILPPRLLVAQLQSLLRW
ncbi:hypothetical protein LIER_40813 [Lithospermum erythrorhizon]|uniref:Uncharacterized protein n=1 Tax=Lithospermum erythrorhizon TaxID=34254 RepID=A0AAV3R415_LITER